MKGVITMKKYYAMLFTFTAIVIIGMQIVKQTIVQSYTDVTIFEVQAETVEETVTCTGKVETAEADNVYLDVPCVAGAVNVEAGDIVQEGDALFTVDVEATNEVLSSFGEVSTMIVSSLITKTVTAPVSGTVSSLNVAEGELVSADTPCVVISSSDVLKVTVAIDENYLKNVQIGQTVFVSGTAFSKDSYMGTITDISSSARQKYTGTTSETVVDAVITLNETDESVKPGLTAKSTIHISEIPDCITIPYEYVLQDNNNCEFVYIYQNGRAVKRIIETGEEFYNGFEILSGLSAGENVITNPEDITKSGEIVTMHEEGEDSNA
jgi:multidrug efflux pump subunit AcrA (membrane-fusion protein)